MEELLAYRRDRIPELRHIIATLPNSVNIANANNRLEEAIDYYIDVIVPNGAPAGAEEENNNNSNNENGAQDNSFIALQPTYDPEIATWGGRRRKTRVKRKTRRYRRKRT